MLQKDRVRWAKEKSADRKAGAKTDTGIWMLREAAKALGLPEETVDVLLRQWRWADWFLNLGSTFMTSPNE